MLGKLIDKVLYDEEEGLEHKGKHKDLGEEIKEEIIEEIEEVKEAITRERKFSLASFLPPLFLFLLAFGVRMAFMLMNDPQSPGYGWYGDVYHHWQIAYLTKAIGLNHGFLRLWDLKGMEYFWGLMHPLVLMALFTLTTSVNIVIARLLSIVCGSFVVVFIYLLMKRYFNSGVAFVVGLWAALFSVALFSDTLGMQEQLGLFLLLAGMLAWPGWGWLTGLLWAMASMVRSEYWLFAVALVLAAFFDRKKKTTESKVIMLVVYLVPILIYMKYMLGHTGNAVFPIYWNYMASVKGEWFTNLDTPLTSIQVIGQWFGRGLFGLGILGSLITFFKRPKHFLFFLLGFFNVTFIGFMFGFGAYIHGFFERFFVDRLLAFPYLFLGILVILFFLYWLPRASGKLGKVVSFFGVLIFLALLAGSQLAWGLIMHYFQMAQAPYKTELQIAEFVAEKDQGGKVVFVSDRPALTYALVKNYNLEGERIVSDMYDPFYYADGSETVQELDQEVIDWMEREGVKTIVHGGKEEYNDLFGRRIDRFKFLGNKINISVYEFLR
ncbi:hypothetical protein ACFL0Y_02955 [Patescibacteria group bacterium]